MHRRYLPSSKLSLLKGSLSLLTAVLIFSVAGLAQNLSGAVDIHVHCDPDVVPRSIDAIGLAKLAQARGMRGLVYKNHYEPTASWAYLAREVVPGIELFGGIVLNRAVGGINPVAVERMAKVKGGWGRVVWMPTYDAENQVRYSKEDRPFVAVSKDGRLLPEVTEVLKLVARYHLIFETGHSSPAECLLLIREAKKEGVKQIVVTHAMLPPVRMSIEQMKQAAALGAYLEFVYNGVIGPNKANDIEDYAAALRAVGPEHCILASDLGQAANPLPPDGFEAFLRALHAQGLSESEIDQMAKVNPAKVLGLE
jgi:Family of unknown function (DUF6282)